MEILYGIQQLLGMKREENEFMTLSSACHGDVNWRCMFYVSVSEMLNAFAAYRCWLLCLLLFISIIVNCGSNKGSNDLLEASENKFNIINAHGRKFKRPSPIELSDFGCFIIVACGITVLQQIDISLIYHIIRGQATIKLYLIDYVKVLTGMCCKCYFIQQKDLQDVPLKRKHTLSVYLCEVAIDVIKHSFIAKFNNITPIAYSEFLEALCKQTLHTQTEDSKKNFKFVPLAPACV
ncbi:protein pollen defective in guidance 1-like, partial [Trifolium pratense]